MAYPERPSRLAALRLQTSFELAHRPRWQPADDDEARVEVEAEHGDGIDRDRTTTSHRDYDAGLGGADEDSSSVLNDLHSSTPPISVPRHEEPPEPDLSYPHKPDDIPASPLDNFIHQRNRRPSVSFDPNVTLDSGSPQPLDQPLAKGDVRPRLQRFQTQARGSGLRNALPQDDEDDENGGQDERREIDQPTSLTSVSTASPVTEELRTPPEGSKGLASPLVASPLQGFSAIDDRPSSWSGSVMTPFGSKRSHRGSTRQSSRRSTASSGKSPASMFLSMWSSVEEPAPKPDDEGQMVGTEYVLGKQIGFGGFSAVKEAYKVEEDGGTKHLAVKIVKKQVSGKSEKENDEVQAEFDHEVGVWRYLSHPHVLTLDAVYETDYATFCFTKLAIGGTLFDLVRQNRRGIDLGLAKKYTFQLACALRYLHEDARVVHRDIKLENCLLDPEELPDGTKTSTLVLCDFGMAEWMTTENGGLSPDPYDNAADRPPPKNIGPAGSSTSVAGSLEYAPPELLASPEGLIRPSVDMWAYGVITYAVLVGSRPFQDAFTPRVQAQIMNGTWNQDAVLGDEQDPHKRQERQHALELITGCLDMDPEKRWTIRDVLSSRWLGDYVDGTESSFVGSPWRL